jgi:hypothetical protein
MGYPDVVSGLVTFANQPVTTVTTGGTDAPAQGTSEQWTVASGALFPVASLSTIPPSSFCVADTAATSEIVQVTAATTSSPWVWGVTRGAENTSPVTHATSFTVMQVVTAGALTNFNQNQNTAFTAATTVGASTVSGTMASYVPSATDIPAAGVCYEFNGFGVFSSGVLATLFTMAVTWNGATIASATKGASGTVVAETGRSFWIEGQVTCYAAATMVSGFNFSTSGSTGTLGEVIGASAAGVSVSGTAGPLALVVTTGALQTFTTTGFVFHRVS